MGKMRFGKMVRAAVIAVACMALAIAFAPNMGAVQPQKAEAAGASNHLIFDQGKINSVGKQGKDAKCMAFSYAYAATIVSGKVYKGNYFWNGNGAVDKLGQFKRYRKKTNQSTLKLVYDSINAGKPCILYVTQHFGKASYQHWVLIVGYKNVTNVKKLALSSFLMLDPYKGSAKTPVKASNNGQKLRYGVDNVRVCKKAVKTTSATPTAKIGFNGNGVESGIKTLNKSVNDTFTIPATKLSRVGYVFDGWNLYRRNDSRWFSAEKGWVAKSALSKSGGAKNYAPSKKLKIDGSWTKGCKASAYTFTYYAQWKPAKASVAYNPNGGVSTIQTQIYNYGNTFQVPMTEPTREGYSFRGWCLYRRDDGKWFSESGGWVNKSALASNGGAKVYVPGRSLTIDISWVRNCSSQKYTFTYYAQWVEQGSAAGGIVVSPV